jgi:RimJ/RimL family protein N-acetyltransferase
VSFELDLEARRMAAFTAGNPDDPDALLERWQRIFRDPAVVKRTITVNSQIAGNIGCFDMMGDQLVGYWIGRNYWGRGVATAALKLMLDEYPFRPLYARVAADNAGSIRVLQKCGFAAVGEVSAYADARQSEVVEIVTVLS